MSNTTTLRSWTVSKRLSATLLLIAIGGGYLAAQVYMRETIAKKYDEKVLVLEKHFGGDLKDGEVVPFEIVGRPGDLVTATLDSDFEATIELFEGEVSDYRKPEEAKIVPDLPLLQFDGTFSEEVLALPARLALARETLIRMRTGAVPFDEGKLIVESAIDETLTLIDDEGIENEALEKFVYQLEETVRVIESERELASAEKRTWVFERTARIEASGKAYGVMIPKFPFANGDYEIGWTVYDGAPSLSVTDVVYEFHGNRESSRFLTAIEGIMNEYIAGEPEEEKLFEFARNSVNREGTTFEQRKKIIEDDARAILEKHCTSCHAPGEEMASIDFTQDRVVDELTAPDTGITIAQLSRTTHFHAFGIGMMLFLACWLFRETRLGEGKKALVVAVTLLGFVFDLGGWWITKFVANGAYLVITGGAMTALGLIAMLLYVFAELWILRTKSPLGAERETFEV
ncbi:MAG: hypothetical protein NUW37_07310 [Planctomycetes bacterium]|nr:hypothetical protein [Planctomycetota bacterium]